MCDINAAMLGEGRKRAAAQGYGMWKALITCHLKLAGTFTAVTDVLDRLHLNLSN